MKRPVFSGHESFQCKTHWLKRGYDFVQNDNNFNDDDAVVKLGVGKNMVASIKYWMKAFGMLDTNNDVTNIAAYLLDDRDGKDPYFENTGTLWLMHYLLVSNDFASIYKIVFSDFHRQRNEIEKAKLQNYIKRICYDANYQNAYNENTVKRDVDVLLHTYTNSRSGNIEDNSSLLMPLNLVKHIDSIKDISGKRSEVYCFNYNNPDSVPEDILLYAIICSKDSISVSFELISDIALIFCLSTNDLLDKIKSICEKYNSEIVFSDIAGIKELQFKRDFNKEEILDNYYGQ